MNEPAPDPVLNDEAHDPVQAKLARSFRRMMVVYPLSYRAEREDEIVGVLLDCARPGQERPLFAERWDLVRAGYNARLLVARASTVGGTMFDLLAALAVVMPFVFAMQSAAPVVWARLGGPPVAGSDYAGMIAIEAAGWALVAICVATRRDRWAGGGALATCAGTYALALRSILTAPLELAGDRLVWLAPGATLFLLVAVLLLHEGSAARGRQLLGVPLMITAAAALAAGSMLVTDLVSRSFAPFIGDAIAGMGVVDGLALAVSVAAGGAAVALAIGRGRRAMVALGAVAAVELVGPIAYYASVHLVTWNTPIALIETVAILVTPVAAAWLFAPRRRPVDHETT